MSSRPTRAIPHQDLLAAAALAVMVALLGAHTLDGFWRSDDTLILAHMLKHSLREIFFVPAAWQDLSAANLTPWVSLSFRLDYALAGLNPRAFYLHHLVALWLVAVVALRLFMLFVDRWWACAGVVLFLLGMPVLQVGDQLFTRHYLEGLLLCLLALYSFLRYRDTGNPRYQLLAALCYALAMTAKETYVPLGILLVCLSSGDRRQRMRQALPHVALIALYILWRGYMLAGHVGGYAQASTYLDTAFWKDVATSFLRMPALLFGGFNVFITTALLGVIGAGFVLRPRSLPLGLLVAGLVFTPLVPLVAYPGITSADRYLLLPWFLCCFAFIVQGQHLLRLAPSRYSGNLLNAAAGLLCLVLALLLLVRRSGEMPDHTLSDVQMRHVWTSDATTAFLPDPSVATSFGMVRALGEVKQLVDPSASRPRAILDPLFLDTALPVYAYSADCTCMRDVSATVPQQLAEFRASLRDAALALTISNENGWIAWDFGPYDTGRYNVISESLGSLPLPANERGRRTNIYRDIELILRYTAPEGWVTYSPPLRLRSDGEVLAWSRE